MLPPRLRRLRRQATEISLVTGPRGSSNGPPQASQESGRGYLPATVGRDQWTSPYPTVRLPLRVHALLRQGLDMSLERRRPAPLAFCARWHRGHHRERRHNSCKSRSVAQRCIAPLGRQEAARPCGVPRRLQRRSGGAGESSSSPFPAGRSRDGVDGCLRPRCANLPKGR